MVSVAAESISTLINHPRCLSRTCTMVLDLLGSRMKGSRSVNAAMPSCDSCILIITLESFRTFTESSMNLFINVVSLHMIESSS